MAELHDQCARWLRRCQTQLSVPEVGAYLSRTQSAFAHIHTPYYCYQFF